MKFENTLTSNWNNAFRGLRNPMNSWDRSDSEGGLYELYGDEGLEVADAWVRQANPGIEEGSDEYCEALEEFYDYFGVNALIQKNDNDIGELFFIGPNDMNLAQRMIRAGSPNDKFLRQIFISVDVTAPLFFFKEFDTYKIGTVANSTSTMHKLASTPITIDCFETDDYNNLIVEDDGNSMFQVKISDRVGTFIDFLEQLRLKYLETKDQRYWKELIRWLPESWLQTRTWTANYDVLRKIYRWRRDHKLTEWHQFCDWIKTLPYADDLICYCNDK